MRENKVLRQHFYLTAGIHYQILEHTKALYLHFWNIIASVIATIISGIEHACKFRRLTQCIQSFAPCTRLEFFSVANYLIASGGESGVTIFQ